MRCSRWSRRFCVCSNRSCARCARRPSGFCDCNCCTRCCRRSMRVCRSVLWRDSMSRCRSCTICCRCWIRCSRCCARVSICSFRDGRAPAAGDVPGLDGAAMRGSGCLVMAGRCGGAARWISGRGAATCGAAGRGGAAIRGGDMRGHGWTLRRGSRTERRCGGSRHGRRRRWAGHRRRWSRWTGHGRWCCWSGCGRSRATWAVTSSLLGERAGAHRNRGDTKKKCCNASAWRKHDLNSLMLRRPEMSTRKRRNRSLVSLTCIAVLRRRCNSSQP